MAANIDEKLVGREMGISKNACYKFSSSSEGVKDMALRMSSMISRSINR